MVIRAYFLAGTIFGIALSLFTEWLITVLVNL